MIPEELYKRRRRHNNTPESMVLIITNYIVLALAMNFFAACEKVNWFFWVIIGLLALYNFYILRKYREEYSKIHIIAYVVSLAGMVLYFFVLRGKAITC